MNHASSSIFSLVFLVLFLACANCRRQLDEDVLATVNGVAITKAQFIKRVEFYPAPAFSSVNGLQGNAGLLELLIAEKLMAAAGRKANLDTVRAFREKVEFLELKAVLEELFKDEVKGRVLIDSSEVMDAFQKSQRRFAIKMLQTRDRQFADEFKRKLTSGLTFAQAMNEFYGQDVRSEDYTHEVSWGDLEEILEESLFELKVGCRSPVIKFSKGYAVIQKDKVFVNPLVTEGEFQRRERGIRKTLRARRMKSLNAQFVSDYMNKQRVIVTGDVFEALSKWLDRIIQYNGELEFSELLTGSREVEFDNMKLALESKLNKPLITFTGGHLTLRESLRKLHIYSVEVNQESPRRMRQQLHADFKRIIQDELLARDAYRRGLRKRAFVQSEVQLWSDYYLSRMFAKSVNLEQKKDREMVFPDTLKALHKRASIQVMQHALETVKTTSTPMVTFRPGPVPRLVVPPWPRF